MLTTAINQRCKFCLMPATSRLMAAGVCLVEGVRLRIFGFTSLGLSIVACIDLSNIDFEFANHRWNP